jgi:hypothetical protein
MKTVIVACKLPAGLIIEVGSLGQDDYARVVIAGPNTSLRTGRNTGLLVGGYAFTPIDEAVWNEFVRTHKNAAYLKNRAVYMEDSIDKAHAAALTDGNTKLGFERLNPDKLPEGLEADAEHLKNAKAQAPKLNAGLPE